MMTFEGAKPFAEGNIESIALAIVGIAGSAARDQAVPYFYFKADEKVDGEDYYYIFYRNPDPSQREIPTK